MSCCCSQSGMGALSRVYGLRGLGALLAGGSKVRVGFSYNTAYQTYEDLNPDWVRQVVIGAMLGSGAFTEAAAVRQPGTWREYLTVYGTTAFDFAQPEDVGDFIQQLIREYLPEVTIYGRDPVVIDSVPAAVANQPNVQQPNYQQYQTPVNRNVSGHSSSSSSLPSSVSGFVNSLARTFGVDQTTALVIGAGGAVLGLILLKRLI
jgi:hypothetical protein